MNGKSKPSETCDWTLDDRHGNKWDTTCGNAFQLETDGPKENGMKFCCYCGRRLRAIEP